MRLYNDENTVQFHHHPEQTKPRLWPGEREPVGTPRQHTAQSVGDQPWWRKEHDLDLCHAQCHPQQCHGLCNHHCQHLLCHFFTRQLCCVNSSVRHDRVKMGEKIETLNTENLM